MSRSPLATVPLKEAVHAYSELLNEVASDGRCDAGELAQLTRRFRSIAVPIARLHDDLLEVDLLIHGKGSESPWTQRQRKERLKSRKHLRLVAANEDGPDPSGPAGMKREAA